MLVANISQIQLFKPAKANLFHLEKNKRSSSLSQNNQNKLLPMLWDAILLWIFRDAFLWRVILVTIKQVF